MDENLRTVGVAVSGRFRIAVTSLLEAASLEFERQRFEQWATNMGLYKAGDVSLDYILRDAPSVQNYARELLESLKSSLIAVADECTSLRSDSRVSPALSPGKASTPSSVSTDSSDDGFLDSYQSEPLGSVLLMSIKNTVDRLYRLSFMIRIGSSVPKSDSEAPYTHQAAVGNTSGQAPPQGLPPNTTFLFSIQEVRPDYNVQGRRADTLFRWLPPDRWNALTPGAPAYNNPPEPLYRWEDGTMSLVDCAYLPEASQLHSHPKCPYLYKAATVFVPTRDSHFFLSVPFDARRANVCTSDPPRWLEIGLDYDSFRWDNRMVYSCVGCPGDSRTLATASVTPYVKDLLPLPYIPENNGSYPTSQDAGLAGSLPLLLALIALSCPPESLQEVLTNSVRLGTWKPHKFQHGRIPERGIVVTVWTDPAGNTTPEILDRLEAGQFGAFFGPESTRLTVQNANMPRAVSTDRYAE